MCENDVFFLPVKLIYSRCGAPASWAARHTIVCLDTPFQYTAGNMLVMVNQRYCLGDSSKLVQC